MSNTDGNLKETLRELHGRTAVLEITVTALTRALIETGKLTPDFRETFNEELERRLAQVSHEEFQQTVRKFGTEWWLPLFETMKPRN
jgi:ribosomal protein S4